MTSRSLFATLLYEADLDAPELMGELAHSIRTFATDDHAGRRAERRRAFRSIQHPQPPRGARPDVDEPAPATQPIGRPIDRTRDGLRLGADRLDHPGVLGIHQRDDLERAERVDRLG